ncbi:uncharacterized protein TRUGW13939_02203 [Talaromyces rugulosus]|uniref:Zn(2)-C6 fungal-type domain-containing protein n=1 Tax=Talaromyces rugulosus TaxID=121627 RepID=A0A7H8QNS4_TALRU|nr:uncharacterized protein TRUGW13939_02203 [Talaromyces rugulosus]QKX55111.1 hypothetical protein TRUGW13939_02203 [Talaromyces rugulosus]
MTGSATVHPSQRRFACDLCRRHKSKCHRIRRNDPKCSRCMALGTECATGQQQRVGRPKQAAADAHDAAKGPVFKSRSTVKRPRTKTPGWHSQKSLLMPHGWSQESPSFPDAYHKPASSSTTSSASWPVPTPSRYTATEHECDPKMIRSTIGMDSIRRTSSTWNTAPGLHHGFSLSDFDSRFNFTITDAHPPDSAANSIYCDPVDLAMPEKEPEANNEGSHALAKLSKINIDLHIRVAAAEMNRTSLDLNSLIYRDSPLFINNHTLAEFILKASEDFVQILTRLCGSQRPASQSLQIQQQSCHDLTSTFLLAFPYAATQPLLAPLMLTIISIFTQLISLYEVLLEHLTTRIERLDVDPITTLPGITFGGVSLEKPCVQGMLFSNAMVQLLERMECALGICEMPEGGKVGLLSARQIDVLWSEIRGRVGITPREGALQPAHVKKLFGKVAGIFHQISLSG